MLESNGRKPLQLPIIRSVFRLNGYGPAKSYR